MPTATPSTPAAAPSARKFAFVHAVDVQRRFALDNAGLQMHFVDGQVRGGIVGEDNVLG